MNRCRGIAKNCEGRFSDGKNECRMRHGSFLIINCKTSNCNRRTNGFCADFLFLPVLSRFRSPAMEKAYSTYSSRKLTENELQNVVDVLRRPLSEREVLIPFGGQAFLPGKLRPIVNSDGHEQVTLKMDESLHLTRQEAKKRIEEKIATYKPGKFQKKALVTKPTGAGKGKQQNDSATSSSLPYYEIREEISDCGKIRKGEVVNITQHMDYLQKQTDGSSNNAREADDVEETIPDVEPTLKQLSDAEFVDLSIRLDELARLEGEAEEKAKTKAPRKVKGNGWTRGFLNQKSKTKKKPPTNNPSREMTFTEKDGSEDSAKTPRVSFHGSDEVREIPRVGTRSIREALPSAIQQRPQPNPIDESVLSGIVQERDSAMASPNPAPPQGPPSRSSRFTRERSDESSNTGAPKRLSRFAQQRQGLR